MENSMETSQKKKKKKKEQQYDPAIPLQDIYLKETKTSTKKYINPMLIVALFTIAKTEKQLSSIDKWVDKYIYMYILYISLLLMYI